MIRSLILIISLFIFASPTIAEVDQRLVLVASEVNNITALSQKELKRTYLGLTLKRTDQVIVPIRNHSDEFAHEVFLQNIISMSSRIYERQLTTRSLRGAGKRPLAEVNREDLVSRLAQIPNSISYMWENDALNDDRVVIIQTLWSGSKK